MALAVGDRLGSYEISALLGAGGMGEVYRARDAKLDRQVAIKVLPDALVRNPERLARFAREAKMLASVSDRNICAIYTVGDEGGVPYIAMELLEGRTLQEQIGSNPMPASAAIEIALQVTAGLEAAHSKGIVHRDIKPANIFITVQGQVKIMDFGLAKVAESTAAAVGGETMTLADFALTTPGSAVGTMAYMSPEQARGESLDARSDIFSFGAVLYEMVTGVRAFRGGTLAAQFDAILHQAPPLAHTLSREVHPGLEAVINKALEKDRNRRYQSVAGMRTDLKRLQQNGAPPALASRFRWPRRLIIPAAAVVLAAAAAGIFWRGGSPGPGPIRSIAVLPLEGIGGGDGYFTDGMTAELIEAMMRVRGWRIISRTSAMQYKGAHKALPVIAKELGVDAVVEGTVQRAGDRVRISARLLRATAKEETLWDQTFDRDVRDVLDLQSDVARAIADQIKLSLSPREQQQLAARHPVDPAVLDLYLQGRAASEPGTEEALYKAIGYFEQAAAKDPSYAPAHAGMALAYGNLTPAYRSPKEVMPDSRKHAQKAIDLSGDTLAEADTALASVMLRFDWDWDGAEREIRHALELTPNSADAHWLYGNYLTALKRFDEGIAESTVAHKLDPLSLSIYADYLGNLVTARRYDRAAAECRAAIDAHPEFGAFYSILGAVYMMTGKLQQAIEATQKAVQLDPNLTTTHLLAMAQAAAGNKTEARKLAHQLEDTAKSHYVCAYEVASVYVQLGDNDKAVQLLRRGQDEQCDCMMWLQSEPWMDPLRADARYAELLRRVGFPAR